MSTDVAVRVKPFYGRIAVAPSPVDETQAKSGLIVPFTEMDDHLNRGVVTDIDAVYDESFGSYRYGTMLRPGVVVWYRGEGNRVGDVIIVDACDIFAYEEETEGPAA